MGQVADPWDFFAARLKELLRASGLTQKQAAELASRQSAGAGAPPVAITNGQISAWVRRANRPPQAALKQLARVLIRHARRIDERLVSEGGAARTYAKGLLDEQSWPKWLQAAHGPAAPAGLSTIREADPTALGVHRAAAVGPQPGSAAEEHLRGGRLTPYLIREHDRLLRQYLAAAAQGGSSAFAVLLGESTTGKTRALYEALLEQAPDHRLLHPTDAEDLQQLFTDGVVVPGTVLWLNETQRYLQGKAGAVIAKQLIRCLTQVTGVVMVGAMWRTPYFTDLTAQGRTFDPGAIRDLLHAHALVLDVPHTLTPEQCEDLRTQAGEGSAGRGVLEAVEAGIRDGGKVIQHLSGGPELLAAYSNRTLFTPVEHALITAALDLRRLGHNQPLPTQLLAEAADGYLTARIRPSEADWASTALDDLTRGYRGADPGDRNDVRHTLTALTRHVARSGTPPNFEPADYLDQHTRGDRGNQLGPPALWDALISHTTDPGDLRRLAVSAQERGLFKAAVALFRQASLAGEAFAPALLTDLLARRRLDPDHHAADWVALHAALLNPHAVAYLLPALTKAGAQGAAQRLLGRQPAAHAELTDPSGVQGLVLALAGVDAEEAVQQLLARQPAARVELTDLYEVADLLLALEAVGASEAVQHLSARAAAHAVAANPFGLPPLLQALKKVGADKAVQQLAARAATEAELTDPSDSGRLLLALKEVGVEDAARHLSARAAAQADLTVPWGTVSLLLALQEVGAGDAAQQLAARAVAHAGLASVSGVGVLLVGLRKAGQEELLQQLSTQVAAHADLTDLIDVAELLSALKKVGAEKELRQVAGRAAAQGDLANPLGVARLLSALREAQAEEAVHQLLARRPAAYVDLTHPTGVASLLSALAQVGAEEAVQQVLARQPAAYADLTYSSWVARLLSALAGVGAEEAVQQLLARQPATHVLPGGRAEHSRLLSALETVGTKESAARDEQLLMRRAMDAGVGDEDAIPQFGRETDGTTAAPWTWHDLYNDPPVEVDPEAGM
ncbi:hypothetical protein [Streptomyces sp. NPDC001594]|uniref:helix-turn-helix domain-containing protein n=1 Tax=Streptomyces sp. NPDC001594 TaxID=3364590 RepID=UPI00367896A5